MCWRGSFININDIIPENMKVYKIKRSWFFFFQIFLGKCLYKLPKDILWMYSDRINNLQSIDVSNTSASKKCMICPNISIWKICGVNYRCINLGSRIYGWIIWNIKKLFFFLIIKIDNKKNYSEQSKLKLNKYAGSHCHSSNSSVIAKKIIKSKINKRKLQEQAKMDTDIIWKNNMEETDMKLCLKIIKN